MRATAFVCLVSISMFAAPVRVKQTQGAAQGFLIVRNAEGRQIGTGNVQQTTVGGKITSRVVYTFDDGSVDDETTVFTQARVFRVLSDRHIQHGPFFEKPVDVAFDAASGIITTREKGEADVKEKQKDIPADVANGLVGTILLNISPNTAPLEFPMIAPTSKGRLIKISVKPQGEGSFTIGGVPHKATIFRIHPQLGGVAGVIAPAIGKQPKDVMVWVLQGHAPALVREIAELSTGGPVVSIELAGASFQTLSAAK